MSTLAEVGLASSAETPEAVTDHTVRDNITGRVRKLASDLDVGPD